jgi:hypothetical protein
MEGTSAFQTQRVSQEQLYELAWKTPMSRLGVEFGSGNGLAKICDRLRVP